MLEKRTLAPAPKEALVAIAEAPERVTALLKVTMPFFVEMLLPIVMPPPAVTEMAPSGVAPPTMPEKVAVPVPAVKVNAWEPAVVPSTVLEKRMFAPVPEEAFVAIVEVPERVVALLKVTRPFFVEMLLPIVMPPPAVTEIAPSGVAPPTMSPKVALPIPVVIVNA